MRTNLSKAILLAAGRGTRLGALTAHTPKPLLTVAGISILARIIGSLASNGISEFAVVTGYLGDQVAQACREIETRAGLRIKTLQQEVLNGTGGAILKARGFVADAERFVFGWGDVLMDSPSYARLIASSNESDSDLILTVNRVDDPHAGAAVYVDSKARVTRLVEKPGRGSSATNWNNAGLFTARSILFDYVHKLVPSERGEIELPGAIAAMIEDGREVRAVAVEGFWSDIGTAEALERARDHFGGANRS
ncbi:MAG TPA: nucleotidyltransferase family protein [Candidatus Binataceae bacterium]